MESFSKTPPIWPDLPTLFNNGLLGATFGEIAVSTLNANVIYQPLLDKPATVVLRDDFHFGLSDPIVHPQPFHISSAYLTVMIASTQAGLDQLLFLPLSLSDWTPSPHDEAYTGLGSLDGDAPGMLIQHGKELIARFKKAVEDASTDSYGNVKREHLQNDKTQRDIWYLKLYHRLLRRPASFEECHLRWVNVQRLHLNLQAYLDWVTIFLPRFKNLPNRPLPVDNSRAGCITKNFTRAMECYYVGIPVWYVYDAIAVRRESFQSYLDDPAVGAILQATCVPARTVQMGTSDESQALFSLMPAPGAAVVWTGEADDPARYAVMSKILQRERSANVAHSLPPPPYFAPEQASTSQTASIPQTLIASQRTASTFPTDSSQIGSSSTNPLSSQGQKRPHSPPNTSSGPTKKKKKSKKGKQTDKSNPSSDNRDRWADVRSAIMPAGIDWWMEVLVEEKIALRATDRDLPSFPGVNKEHAFYAAPDGFIVAGIKNEATQAGYLVNYARLRPLLHYRLDAAIADPKAVKNIHPQTWRSFLGLGVLGAKTSTGRAATKRVTSMETLEKIMSEDQPVSFNLSKIRTIEAQWNGVVLSDDGTLPPTNICREMLWEMYELNFRSELILLDSFVFHWEGERRKQGGEPLSPADRRTTVLNLIPYFDSGVVVDRSDFVSRGFAAHSAIERCIALQGLVDVMREWNGDAVLPAEIETLAGKLKGRGAVFPDQVNEFGKAVGRHYIRTFYKVFARPPTLPRRLVPQV